MPTYQTRNPLARTNPLRSIPFMRPVSAVRWSPIEIGMPAPIPAIVEPARPAYTPTARELAERALRNAEAALCEAMRVHTAARIGIGKANRTTLAVTTPAFILRQMRNPPAPVLLTAEQVRARKSAAFSTFNKRRGELTRARRRVDAARAALGLPSLIEQAEQEGVAPVRVICRRAAVATIAIAIA